MTEDFDAIEHHIFAGLRSTQPSWSHSTERFFKRDEFVKVVHRCHALGFCINGVEVFGRDAQLLAVEINLGEPGARWAMAVADQWTSPELLFSATYSPSKRFAESSRRTQLRPEVHLGTEIS